MENLLINTYSYNQGFIKNRIIEPITIQQIFDNDTLFVYDPKVEYVLKRFDEKNIIGLILYFLCSMENNLVQLII